MTWTVPTVPADGDLADELTGPWQVALRGVLFDACDSDAALVVSRFLDGFGVPETRNNDKPRPQRHGLFASPQYLGGRTMTVEIVARGATHAAVIDALADLGFAWAPVADTDTDLVVPLAFTLGDAATKYLVFGKPQRAPGRMNVLPLTYDGDEPFADAYVAEFLATDPRIYSATPGADSTGLGSSSGGHSFPLGFPHGFGSASPGTMTLTNGGNFPTYPTFTVTAGGSGLSGIQILNATTGEEWSITITLAAGDTLVVDMAEGTALLNGTASRDNLVNRPPSTWWDLDPGANTVQFVGTGTGSTLAVEWRDAWMI